MRFPLAPLSGLAFVLAAPVAMAPMPSAQAQGQNQDQSPARLGSAPSRQALIARDQAFAILDAQVKGGVQEPPMAMLGAPDLDTWLFRRYYSITEDSTLSKPQRERMIAGTIHQDLQLAEYGLTLNDPLAQKQALRVATIANLYVGMLPADPRLQAALYEGFLLPNVAMAPEKGWGAQPALLEGAAVANRMIGQTNRQIGLLSQLIDYQKKGGDVPGADIARIHLSDALEGREQYFEAFEELSAVTTPDLLGAKWHLEELWNKAREQKDRQQTERERAAFLARGAAATAATADKGTQNQGMDDAAGNAGAAVGDSLPKLPPGGFGVATRGGRRFAQNNGGGGRAGDTTEGEAGEGDALDGESEKMRRMRRATEAAQIAKERTKKADELSTISLAKMLDATDAQRALETADKGGAPARRRGARLNDGAEAPATDIFTLRRTAEKLAREASEAAGDAKRATIAAQTASEAAAKLALRVFIVDHDTPGEGETTAPISDEADVQTPENAPAPIQPALPEQNRETTPTEVTENQTR